MDNLSNYHQAIVDRSKRLYKQGKNTAEVKSVLFAERYPVKDIELAISHLREKGFLQTRIGGRS